LYGVVLGAVVVALLYGIRDARIRAGYSQRTLDRFPTASQSTATPVDLVRTSRSARLTIAVLSLFLAVFVLLMIAAGIAILSM
jgi:hypothetical protein